MEFVKFQLLPKPNIKPSQHDGSMENPLMEIKNKGKIKPDWRHEKFISRNPDFQTHQHKPDHHHNILLVFKTQTLTDLR